MPSARPRLQIATPEPVLQSGLPSDSDSDVFCLDPTIQSRRAAPRKFSHYELLESIGEGQFGTVWRARDQRLDRIVAVKLPHLTDFDERRRTHFLREARASAVLRHPNIVQIYGVEQDEEQPGIISQFIEGRTLFHLLQDQRPTFGESASILATVADAVHHAHEAGVIHRDLKPSNILMDSEGRPHVSDFGLAKWSGDQALLTNPGVVLGTPAYMSPEQAQRGDSHIVDRRSDVYSLGVLLYELLTGKPPFEGNSTLLLHQIQSQDPRVPRSLDKTIPLDLETICLKCLAKSPAERYATAHELAGDLQKFLVGEPISARAMNFTDRSIRWMRRNPTVVALLVVSVLSTITAISLGAVIFTPAKSDSVVVPPATPAQAAQPTERKLNVSLKTEPEGATVVFYPLDESTGEPLISQAVRPSEKSPVTVELVPGDYLIVAALPDGRFHEVYRYVPRNLNMPRRFYPHSLWTVTSEDSIALYSVRIPPLRDDPDMTLLANTMTNPKDPAVLIINAFLLDQREVTVGQFLPTFNNQLPPSLRGRPELLTTLDLPITGLFFDEAMTHAEFAGKRLPTAAEYEFAATNGWTTLFPWGDSEPPSEAWQLTSGHKGFDVTATNPPVFGLFSNASEFVFTGASPRFDDTPANLLWLSPGTSGSLVRGGPISAKTSLDDLKDRGARWKVSTSRTLLSSNVGFRCARSKSPRL